MTPCYEPLKNMLIALGNTFEVIGMQKNNILGKKTKKHKKTVLKSKNTVQGVWVLPGSVTPVYLILALKTQALTNMQVQWRPKSAGKWHPL